MRKLSALFLGTGVYNFSELLGLPTIWNAILHMSLSEACIFVCACNPKQMLQYLHEGQNSFANALSKWIFLVAKQCTTLNWLIPCNYFAEDLLLQVNEYRM